MKNAPWNTDDIEVLREKWRVANARALECEQLKHRFSLIAIQHRSESSANLHASLDTARRVGEIAVLASSGLFPTGLLRDDFNWMVSREGENQLEKLDQAKEAASQVPQCPGYLLRDHSRNAMALISLIQTKRWEKLLSQFSQYAGCIAELARRFADALNDSLIQRVPDQSTGFQPKVSGEEPQDSDEWESYAKASITLLGIEPDLRPRERLVLARLICVRDKWLTSGDIAVICTKWNDLESPAQAISSQLTKLETKLGEQLEIEFQKGKANKLNRPVQRRTSTAGKAEYRLHPDLRSLRSAKPYSGKKQ